MGAHTGASRFLRGFALMMVAALLAGMESGVANGAAASSPADPPRRSSCSRIITGSIVTSLFLAVGTVGYAVLPDRPLQEVEIQVLPAPDHREELKLARAKFMDEIVPLEGWHMAPRALVVGFDDQKIPVKMQNHPRPLSRRLLFRPHEQEPAVVTWQHRNVYLVVGTVKDAKTGVLRAETRLVTFAPDEIRVKPVWFQATGGGATQFRPTRGPDRSDAAVADGFRRHPDVVAAIEQWKEAGTMEGALNIVALGESSTEGQQFLVIQYGTNPGLGFGDGPVHLIRAIISFPRNSSPTLRFFEAKEPVLQP